MLVRGGDVEPCMVGGEYGGVWGTKERGKRVVVRLT